MSSIGIRTVAVAVIAAISTALIATIGIAPADARTVAAEDLPDVLKPPAGLSHLGGNWVQNGYMTYTCVGGEFTGAPVSNATLVGSAGPLYHTDGTSFRSVVDDVRFIATPIAEEAVGFDLPGVLMRVDAVTGSGHLAEVKYIQRLYGTGGIRPSEPCTDGETVSRIYGALYQFWG